MWNTVKSKCHAVRVEKGLVESIEIVLVRDTKLFVFTDKGLASLTDSLTLIFQY